MSWFTTKKTISVSELSSTKLAVRYAASIKNKAGCGCVDYLHNIRIAGVIVPNVRIYWNDNSNFRYLAKMQGNNAIQKVYLKEIATLEDLDKKINEIR